MERMQRMQRVVKGSVEIVGTAMPSIPSCGQCYHSIRFVFPKGLNSFIRLAEMTQTLIQAIEANVITLYNVY